MRSLYDDIFAVLENHEFSIAPVSVRRPFDEGAKTYPMLVLHELVNRPREYATVSGEQRTNLAYQIDILTRACVDKNGEVLGRWQAGRRLSEEVSDLLDGTLKITRRSMRHESPNPDVSLTIWRGESVYDSYGYTYRR